MRRYSRFSRGRKRETANSPFHYRSALLTAGLLLACARRSAKRSSAGSLSTRVIGMFPKEVGEFAYADLKSARKFPWFSAAARTAAAEPLPPVRAVPRPRRAWTRTPRSTSSPGAGSLPDKGAARKSSALRWDRSIPLRPKPVSSSRNCRCSTCTATISTPSAAAPDPTDILFTFIDSNTAAFGAAAALEKLIDVRTGAAESLLTNDQALSADQRSERQRAHLGRARPELHAYGHAAACSRRPTSFRRPPRL